MRVVALAALFVLPVAAQQPSHFYGAPGDHKTLQEHLFGTPSFIRSAISTGVNQLTNGPEEWGRGPDTVGRRYASSFGRHLIRASVQYSAAEALRQDLRYFPSNKDGFGGRLKHALASTFVARNMDTGEPTFASARMMGVFSAGFVSRTWMPQRLQTVQSGFTTSAVSIGFDAGFNVLREFWPDIRGKRRHRSDEP